MGIDQNLTTPFYQETSWCDLDFGDGNAFADRDDYQSPSLVDRLEWLSGVRLSDVVEENGLELLNQRFRDLETQELIPSDVFGLAFSILLNTTSFFRVGTPWQEIIAFAKELKSQARAIKIASVGCSTGEEALSIAYIFSCLEITDYEIIAIDINPKIISKARESFNEKTYIDQSFKRLKMIAEKEFPDLPICKAQSGEVSAKIRFVCCDLESNFGSDFDLIVCANALWYYEGPRFPQMLKRLQERVSDRGVLILDSDTQEVCAQINDEDS